MDIQNDLLGDAIEKACMERSKDRLKQLLRLYAENPDAVKRIREGFPEIDRRIQRGIERAKQIEREMNEYYARLEMEGHKDNVIPFPGPDSGT